MASSVFIRQCQSLSGNIQYFENAKRDSTRREGLADDIDHLFQRGKIEFHVRDGGNADDRFPLLERLIYLKQETSVWFELTTLLIPDENDSDDELDRKDTAGHGNISDPMVPCIVPHFILIIEW